MLISRVAQEWLDQGREEGLERGLQQGKRQLLLDLITYRFGSLDPALRAALDACNREQLSAVSHIVLDASSATVAQIRTVLETVGKEKRTMLISPAAQEWLEQGREEGVERGLEQGKRQLLVDLITYRFGAPDTALRAALDACNREQLSAVSHIVLDASSAAEMLRNIRRMALADV